MVSFSGSEVGVIRDVSFADGDRREAPLLSARQDDVDLAVVDHNRRQKAVRAEVVPEAGDRP